MFRNVAVTALISAAALSLWAAGGTPAVKPAYPATPARIVTDDYFGTKVEDPYRWLEKGDDPEVVAWTEAQNAATRKFLDAFPGRPAIVKELTALWDYPRMGTPAQYGDRYFYTQERRPPEPVPPLRPAGARRQGVGPRRPQLPLLGRDGGHGLVVPQREGDLRGLRHVRLGNGAGHLARP